MSSECEAIIDKLIAQRRRRGMSQRSLAAMTQIQQPVIARMESKAATPRLDTILKIAEALGCSLEIVPHEQQ